jgi:hypothetical protein
MSDGGLAYRQQTTGNAPTVTEQGTMIDQWRLAGEDFHGYVESTGHLQTAYGPGEDRILQIAGNSELQRLQTKMTGQFHAARMAGGVPVDWSFADPGVASIMAAYAQDNSFDSLISVQWVPAK